MSDRSLRTALRAKSDARDALNAEVALMDIKIKEHQSITRYMMACQKTNYKSLHAATMQVAQISAYMQMYRNFTTQDMGITDGSALEDSDGGTDDEQDHEEDEEDEDSLQSRSQCFVND